MRAIFILLLAISWIASSEQKAKSSKMKSHPNRTSTHKEEIQQSMDLDLDEIYNWIMGYKTNAPEEAAPLPQAKPQKKKGKKKSHKSHIPPQEIQDLNLFSSTYKYLLGIGALAWAVICLMACVCFNSCMGWVFGSSPVAILCGIFELGLFKFVDHIYKEPKKKKK